MMGIYLSGTGNTKHCVEKLVNLLDAAAECIPLEAPHVTETLEKQSTIILGYPTQFSNSLAENADASDTQYNRVLTTEDFEAVWKTGTLLPDNIYITLEM